MLFSLVTHQLSFFDEKSVWIGEGGTDLFLKHNFMPDSLRFISLN